MMCRVCDFFRHTDEYSQGALFFFPLFFSFLFFFLISLPFFLYQSEELVLFKLNLEMMGVKGIERGGGGGKVRKVLGVLRTTGRIRGPLETVKL